MASDSTLLLDQCFDLDRSKVSIKIVNFDIEKRPVTVELESQTDVSELLGRIDVTIDAKEPEIERFDVELLAQEPEIIRLEKEVIAVEPEVPRSNVSVTAEEPKVESADVFVYAVEPEVPRSDVSVTAVEPEIPKSNVALMAVEVPVETFDKELTAEEPPKETADVGLLAEYKVEKSDIGLLSQPPVVVRVERETITSENSQSKREVYTEITADLELYENAEVNPLLQEVPDYVSDFEGSLSSISSTEFETNKEGFSILSDDDPKSIITWNVSGLAHTKSKKDVWESFVQLIRQHDPDIVILQDVKLCSSKILGVCPRLSMRSYGGHVNPSYVQEVQDADLVKELERTTFKKYYCIHSLSAWRVAGQLVFIKKEFKYLKIRFNMNIKTNAKYHHPEGRCIIVQFNSFYLLSLLSPLQGWVGRSVMLRNTWDRELALFLDNSKSKKATIISGNLNCAPEDIDLSDPAKLKMENSVVLHKQEEVGYPGSRDIDREGYHWVITAGNLKDVFRYKHPYDGTEKTEKNIKFTTLAFLSDKTRCAVRTNLVLMSRMFLKNVKKCDIIGNTDNLDPSGWRHLPQLLKLVKR